jgi:hypothetical protein
VPVAVGLLGLGFVAVCIVPFVVVAFRYLAVASVLLAGVAAWLAWLCVGLVLARAELRINSAGISAVGRRRQDVAWPWESVAVVGFLTFKGHEMLALRLVDDATPKLKFFLYPTWSDELRAVVLGRVDYFSIPRRNIEEALRRHAGERWRAELEPAS